MKSDLLIQRIAEKRYDSLFEDIYLNKDIIDYQRKRYIEAIEKYQKNFGHNDVSVFSVPGRSEIGGNHTDHQNGKVLACAVNLRPAPFPRSAPAFPPAAPARPGRRPTLRRALRS